MKIQARVLCFLTLFIIISAPVAASAMANQRISETLQLGMRGESVRLLQVVLNKNTETAIALEGAGSAGKETGYFGKATLAALKKYQELHADEVLVPAGLTVASGIAGKNTRLVLNRELSGSSGDSTSTPVASSTKELTFEELDARIAATQARLEESIAQSELNLRNMPNLSLPDISEIEKKVANMAAYQNKVDEMAKLGSDDMFRVLSATNTKPKIDAFYPFTPMTGQEVQLLGSGFSALDVVHFGKYILSVATSTQLGITTTIIVPPGLSAGDYEVYVENAKGRSDSLFLPVIRGPESPAL